MSNPLSPYFTNSPNYQPTQELDTKMDSPLSEAGLHGRLLKRLFISEEPKSSLDNHEISWINPPEINHLQEMFDTFLDASFQDAISKIVVALNRINVQEVSQGVRYLLHSIYLQSRNSLTDDEVLIEISLILFYLERDLKLPEKTRLISFRLKEIKDEIARLKHSSLSYFQPCKTTYLLRAFCNLCFLASGQINIGGVKAVCYLLESELSKEFNDGQIYMLRETFRFLSEDLEFQEKISAPLSNIHPTMADFIRIDQKLTEDAPIQNQHVSSTLLLALLHDLRQYHLPNCFSIASLIWAICTSPKSVIDKYRHLISEGTIEICDTKIPVHKFLYDRFKFNPDLDLKVTPEEFVQTTIFKLILRATNSYYTPPDSKQEISVREIFSGLITKKSIPHQPISETAVLLLASFKRNIFQELLLAEIEFLETNSTTETSILDDNSILRPRPVKKTILIFIQNFVREALYSSNQQAIELFCQEFKNQLEKHLWLQEVSESIAINDEDKTFTIHFTDQSPFNFSYQGDKAELVSFFSKIRLLIFLEDGKPIKLVHRNTFESAIIKMANNALKNHEEFEKKFFEASIKELLKRDLADELASFLARINQFAPFEIDHYKQSGLIAFTQDGGIIKELPEKIFNLKTSYFLFSNQNPVENFYQIFEYLHSLPEKKSFLNLHGALLCSSNHAFTIRPYLFSQIWNSGRSKPKSVIDYCSNQPCDLLFNNPLNREEKLNLLKKVDPNGIYSNWLANCIDILSTGNDFFKTFNTIPKIDLILYDELTKINIQDFDFEKILKCTPARIPEKVKNRIDNQIREDLKASSELFLSPIELAVIVQNAWNAYFEKRSLTVLENIICLAYKRPVSWEIGDLNYGNYNQTSAHHAKLVIKFIRSNPYFFHREGTTDTLLSASAINSMTNLHVIHMPVTAPSPKDEDF